MNDAASDIHPPHRDDDRQLTDAAVLAKTGKTWSEWFSILDAAGADPDCRILVELNVQLLADKQ